MPETPRPGPVATNLRPPQAERRPVRLEAHGDVRIDDWFWLRDKEDPEVIAHLEAENAYTEATMAGTAPLREALYDEMVARIEETDLSVPARKGPWLYYGRTVEGSSYAIHCRRPAQGPEDVEEVLLDENLLAEGHDYFALGALSVSPDHRWLAYSTDTTGGERHTMRFLDLTTGPRRPRRSRTPPTEWPGPTTMPPSSTSGWTRRCDPSSSGATGWAPTRRRTPWCSRNPTTASTSG